MKAFFRKLFAPITIRYLDTDDLQETLSMLGMVEREKIGPTLARTEKLIARELIRRGVRFWEF